MGAIKARRVLLGAVGGWVAWAAWSLAVNTVVLGPRYEAGQAAGTFLAAPRYPFFIGQWLLVLFLLSCILAWLYAGVRGTYGPGPKTALAVGVLVGFGAGFPVDFAVAAWMPLDRVFPLWWMLELWVGAVLAVLVAAWLYRD